MEHWQTKFVTNWPRNISQAASRKWANIEVKNSHYEIQTTFCTFQTSALDHDLLGVYLQNVDVREFEQWVEAVCNRFADKNVTEDWLLAQPVWKELSEMLQIRIRAVSSFEADPPGPQDHTSFHLCFMLSRII